MNAGLIVGIVVGVVVLIIVIWIIATYNRVNTAELKCQQALSGIDVALTKRYDMLTKLLATAKKYADFEKATIVETIKMRSGAGVQEQMKTNAKLNEAQTQLFGIAENYPELHVSENYKALQDGIIDAEQHLQAARRAYNAAVDALNKLFVTFPSNVIANKTGKKQREFFEADEQHKQDVVID